MSDDMKVVRCIRVPLELDSNTTHLVTVFAEALAEKLHAAEVKYNYGHSWMHSDWQDDCVRRLYEHARKGDPRDVAAFCAFCWHHGWSTANDPEIAALKAEIARLRERASDLLVTPEEQAFNELVDGDD